MSFTRSEYGWVLRIGKMHLCKYPNGICLGWQSVEDDMYQHRLGIDWW